MVKTNYLNECLLCEVSFNNKKGYIESYVDSPAKNQLEFDTFISNFEKMLGDIHSFNPDFSVLGNFNARSNKWLVGNNQTSEGSQIAQNCLWLLANNIRTNICFEKFFFLPNFH